MMGKSIPFYISNQPFSKLNLPALPNQFLPRPRLQAKLKSAGPYKVIIVSAPAGYGKTIFISEVLSLQNRPIAWLSLDKYDNSPARFWSNIIASVQKINKQFCENALSMIFSREPIIIGITEFINEITQKIPDIIFALDDYHVIDNQDIHNSLEYLIDYLPNQSQVIISSRSDPPLPLTKWHGRGYILEIKANDLKFTQEEARALLDLMGISISHEQMYTLYKQTEGWITGLKMAALLILSSGNVHQDVHNFGTTNKEILDYLTNEVLEKQESHIKKFLMDISIVEQFNAGLCDAITNKNNSAEIINYLLRKNLFIQLADHQGTFYSLHPLLRNLLKNRLQSWQPKRLKILHKRASKWYELNGFLESAIEHALIAKEFERAAYLIQQIAINMLGQGKYILFKEWIDRLPQQLIIKNLQICLASAILADAVRKIDDEERYREYIETIINSNFNKYTFNNSINIGGLVATVIALGAYYKNNFDDAISIATEAYKSLREREDSARCTLCAILGATHWVKGNLQMSFKYWNQCAGLAKKLRYDFIYKVSTACKAHIYFNKGYLRTAEDTCMEALELIQNRLIDTGKGIEYLYLLLGQIYYQKNMLSESEKYTTLAIENARNFREPVICLNGHLGMARINLANEHIEDAMSNIRKARNYVYDCDSRYLLTYDTFATLFYLRLGNIRQALDYAKNWADIDSMEASPIIKSDLLTSDIRDIWCENPLIVLLRVYLARNDLNRVVATSEYLYTVLQQKQLIFNMIECQLIRCLALKELNRTEEAVSVLSEVIKIANNENFIRLFVDEGQSILKLLKIAMNKGVFSAYLGKLISSFQSHSKTTQLNVTKAQETVNTEQSDTYNLPQHNLQFLSQREYEILQLLKNGFSNKMISEKLTISVPTVKTHLFYLYRKLGAENRAQAILKAHQLGILM